MIKFENKMMKLKLIFWIFWVLFLLMNLIQDQYLIQVDGQHANE